MDIMTTRVEVRTSSLDGQFTFFNSALDSFKKLNIFFNPSSFCFTRGYNTPIRPRRIPDHNIHPIKKAGKLLFKYNNSSAGQAGFEPATSGFGDRRSTSWSYWPLLYDDKSLFLIPAPGKPVIPGYLICVSLCSVCFPHRGQYFLNCNFDGVFFLFLSEV